MQRLHNSHSSCGQLKKVCDLCANMTCQGFADTQTSFLRAVFNLLPGYVLPATLTTHQDQDQLEPFYPSC